MILQSHASHSVSRIYLDHSASSHCLAMRTDVAGCHVVRFLRRISVHYLSSLCCIWTEDKCLNPSGLVEEGFDHRGIQLFECRSWIGGDSAEAETSVMMEGSVGDFTFQQYLAIKSMFVHLNNAAATIHHNSEKMK